MKKGAYFFVYLLPITVAIAFNSQGWGTFLPIILFFGLIPFFELFLPANHANPKQLENRKNATFYDWIIYLSVPVQVGFLFYFFSLLNGQNIKPIIFIQLKTVYGFFTIHFKPYPLYFLV